MIFLFFKKSGPAYKKRSGAPAHPLGLKVGPLYLTSLTHFKKKKLLEFCLNKIFRILF
jgi:hypothetical protein